MADRKPRWVYFHPRHCTAGAWCIMAADAYATIEHQDGGTYRFQVHHLQPNEMHDPERGIRMYCPSLAEIAHGEPTRDPRKARRDGKACLDRWMARSRLDRCRHVNALWLDAHDKAMRGCVERDAEGLPVPPWAWAANAGNPRFREDMAPGPGCIGWRMGEGESYLDGFARIWADTPAEERTRILAQYPPPEGWAGWRDHA